MGFWSFVKNTAGSAVKGITNFISKGGFGIISGVASWIKENIFGIDETPSYSPNEATIDETKKINELLEKCIKSYSKEAEEYDEIARRILEEQFSLLQEKLKNINEISGKKVIDDYIFKSFESNLNHLKKDLDKIYSKKIADVFSLNNNELLDILKLEKGNEKKEKIRKLAVKTIIDANNNLLEELSKFIKEQQEFISLKLSEYIKNLKNDYIIAKTATEKILKASEKDREYRLNLEKKYKAIEEKLSLLDSILLEEKC